MRASLEIIISRAMDIISGVIKGNTKECGKITKCTGEESSHGLMEGSTRDSMLMIKKKEEEPLVGLMDDSILEAGRTASKMVKESTEIRMVTVNKVSGNKEKN